MKQPRIPVQVLLFNNWLNATNTYLQSDDPDNPGHKQWERLGLTNAEATAWDDGATNWNAMYAKYKDKSLRTLAIMRQCRDFRVEFTRQTRGVINRIAANPLVNEQDATTFNFVLVRKKPEKPTTIIEASVITGITRLGSGDISVACRYKKDTKRASLLPIADGVEYTYKVTTSQPGDPATVDPEGEGFRQRYVSKAKFIIKTGTANKGKYLLIAFRWVNSKYPNLAGSWGEVQVMLLV